MTFGHVPEHYRCSSKKHGRYFVCVSVRLQDPGTLLTKINFGECKWESVAIGF